MTRPNHRNNQAHRPTETLPELDAILLAEVASRGRQLQVRIPDRDTASLLGNPDLDLDSETTDWLAERESALRAAESGHGLG